jgi:hypothetical protein
LHNPLSSAFALIVAVGLCRQHVAVEIISAYEKTVEEYPENERYEHSEMLLYKASLAPSLVPFRALLVRLL